MVKSLDMLICTADVFYIAKRLIILWIFEMRSPKDRSMNAQNISMLYSTMVKRHLAILHSFLIGLTLQGDLVINHFLRCMGTYDRKEPSLGKEFHPEDQSRD